MILPPHGKNPAKKARPRLFRIWRQPCLIDLPGCKKGIAADENEELFRESTKKYPDVIPPEARRRYSSMGEYSSKRSHWKTSSASSTTNWRDLNRSNCS